MEEGLSPIGIISVIEREDERKLKVLKNGTLKFDSLFKHSEFEDFIRKKKEQQKIK
jgi:orotate phosphoribosyltransferase